MTFAIEEEINAKAEHTYWLLVDNHYRAGFETEQDARQAIEKIKAEKIAVGSRIIYEETAE